MSAIIRTAVGLALVVLLAACNLVSDGPLIPASEGEKVFGDSLGAIQQFEGGVLIGSDGKMSFLNARFSDGRYIVDDATWLSFHKPEQGSFDYVAQFVGASQTVYYGIRVEEGLLRAENIQLDASDLAQLAAGGVTPLDDGGDKKVTSRLALDLALSAWGKRRYDDLLNPTEYVATFLVPATREAGLELFYEGATQSCLAAAGHPLDPVVRAFPGTLSHGVELSEIDTAKALERCAWTSQIDDASASARYALLRAYFAAGRYDDLREGLDALLREKFDLAAIFKADMLVRGLGETADAAAARQVLEPFAASSPLIAAYLGSMYLNGQGGDADYARARELIETSVRAGHPLGQFWLGQLYMQGKGVEKDSARALRYFRSASDGGYAAGAQAAGAMLYFAEGVEQDYKAAFEYYKLAAERGLTDSQYVLGFMYAAGQGTAKAESTAYSWLKKAADKGHHTAKAELGRLTYYGLGTTEDKAGGLALLRDAAAAGDDVAKGYLEGIGGSGGQSSTTKLPPFGDDVPQSVRTSVEQLASGKPFQFNEVNLPFLGGMAQYISETCGLPSNASDRVELAGFALNGASFMLGGNDYSNPDLGAAMGNMLTQGALFTSGTVFARELGCENGAATVIADGIVEASRSNRQGADGGLSTFVKTCTPAFDQARCQCLAQVARGAIPDIHQRSYSREIIAELIQRNPLLGMTVLACGIVNY